MIISKIEFENFRNFKESGKIICDTTGKVTLIYGKNGDGKTTLHQLFQWVFYNKVHFNKTTSEKMYNHEFESEKQYNDTFSVWGCIDFKHNHEYYSLRREWVYRKGLDDSKKIQEIVSLNKKDKDNNWNRISNPSAVIEELLPSGLSEYFFFDGESMIADLKVKGKDSANKLRQALYTIFDLNLLEQALIHIGNKELKTTVLGNLYLNKANVNSGSNINVVKTNIEQAQAKIAALEEEKQKAKGEVAQKKEFLKQVSEKIGTSKSKEEYEKRRKQLKIQRDTFLENIKTSQVSFGDEVIATFPKMLLSKTIEDAKKIIKLKIDQTSLMPGVSKTLIDSLLKEKKCICGRVLTDEERQYLQDYLKFLPPLSFKSTYDNFCKEARHWGQKYERERIEVYIKQVLSNKDQATRCDLEIHKLDEEEKKSQDVQSLIIDRQKAENRISELSDTIIELEKSITKFNLYLRKQMKDFDELTSQSDLNKVISKKMDIMQEVKNHFEQKLKDASSDYSDKLKEEIQILLNKMLTSKRSVTVSNDFFVRVFDSYDDESKSEGQFAVVSFAYIGGILNLLKKEVGLSSKEYPLVLDGPFSKLDPDQRQNVINTIPEYAPQIILFSKDNLQDYFEKDVVGRVWTITSNDEKNVAMIEEGFLW